MFSTAFDLAGVDMTVKLVSERREQTFGKWTRLFACASEFSQNLVPTWVCEKIGQLQT